MLRKGTAGSQKGAKDNDSKSFISDVLGFALASPSGTPGNYVGGMEWHKGRNPVSYSVEKADAIKTSSRWRSRVWIKYDQSSMGAATWAEKDGYKSAAIAVPIEALKQQSDMSVLMKTVFDWFEGQSIKAVNKK